MTAVMLWLTACMPSAGDADLEPMPTLIPSATAAINLEDGQRVATLFLDAWQQNEFDFMYRLLSYSTQEAIPLENFRNLYTGAHNTMGLESLEIVPRTLLRNGPQLVTFSYDITFDTERLGSFTDSNRNLMMVIDPHYNEWRVAWSPGDIFPEMANGATLRFEPRIPSRANIYDRNGAVLADQKGITVQTSLIKNDVVDMAGCVALLAELTGRDAGFIQGIIDRAGGDWVIDVGTIEPPAYNSRGEELRSLCNASFRQQAIRQYPRGSLMPHILGHVGYPDEAEIEGLVRAGFNQETIIGKSGIEKTWDTVLRGQPGGRLSLLAPNGTRLRILAETDTTIPESLWLTIDSDLQEFVMRRMGETWDANAAGWGATSKGGAAIVMEVDTGEILAMVSWPTFEGNALTPFPAVGREVAQAELASLANDPRNPQLNRATLGSYPAGSIWKAIDAIAVADSGVYEMNESYVCSGFWQQGNDRRVDWLAGGHGRVTIGTALASSCNPFFYQTGYRMNEADPYMLPTYARRLGMGSITGLGDLPEAPGIIGDPEWVRINRGTTWTFSNAVSMAIGQGEVEVTPLQMLRFYAGIANGGDLMRPRLVRERGILDQRSFVAEPEVMSEFGLREDVLPMIHTGLCQTTTENFGTVTYLFRNSALQNLGVCGKTGTATSGPSGQLPHSWFVAYAPREEPEIIVIVLIETAGDGSAFAAPVTRDIMEYYFFGSDS